MVWGISAFHSRSTERHLHCKVHGTRHVHNAHRCVCFLFPIPSFTLGSVTSLARSPRRTLRLSSLFFRLSSINFPSSSITNPSLSVLFPVSVCQKLSLSALSRFDWHNAGKFVSPAHRLLSLVEKLDSFHHDDSVVNGRKSIPLMILWLKDFNRKWWACVQ